MNGAGTREPSAELGRYSKATYANLARMGKYRKCQNEKEVIQKMKRILMINGDYRWYSKQKCQF